MTQALEQQRARFALVEISALENAPFQKECRAYLSNLPAMIRMSGLGQTMAFCLMKSQEKNSLGHAYQAIYKIIEKWFKENNQTILKNISSHYKGLMEAITSADMLTYRQAEIELLQLLDWLKKFARAILKGE